MDSSDIGRFYEYFYSKVYNFSDYRYNPNPRDLKIISNFILFLSSNSSLGYEWLFYYFAFQFQYWSSLKYKRISTVVISYILGDKALKRYENKHEYWKYYIDQFIKSFKLDKKDLYSEDFYKKDLINISFSEEIDKERFQGIERLVNCIVNTTMYNEKSSICILCCEVEECKKILKDKYPYIYKIRNEKTIVEKSYS